jgi:hypothetical protein
LTDAKAHLEESLSRSKFLSGIKKASVSMLGGTLAAGMALMLNPAAAFYAAIAGAAASATVAGIEKAGDTKGVPASRREARQASLPHYVAVLR